MPPNKNKEVTKFAPKNQHLGHLNLPICFHLGLTFSDPLAILHLIWAEFSILSWLLLGVMWVLPLGLHLGLIFLFLDYEICLALSPFFIIILGFFHDNHLLDYHWSLSIFDERMPQWVLSALAVTTGGEVKAFTFPVLPKMFDVRGVTCLPHLPPLPF